MPIQKVKGKQDSEVDVDERIKALTARLEALLEKARRIEEELRLNRGALSG